MGRFYLLHDEVFESEDDLDLPIIGETKAEAVAWLKGWLGATLPYATRMQRMMNSAVNLTPWPKAGPDELGCPMCGTLIGEQDGENCHFCPACGWEGVAS